MCLSQPAAVKCVLNCEQQMLIKGAQRMKEHLIEACFNMKGSCVNCKLEMIRKDLDTHICNGSSEQKIATQATEIERLAQENATKNDLLDQFKHDFS